MINHHIARRLAQLIPILFFITFLSFVMMRLAGAVPAPFGRSGMPPFSPHSA